MKSRIQFVVLSLIILFYTHNALAAGFALSEHSVSGLGNAFAGGAAVAEDASTIYYNPAGLMLLEGQSIQASTYVIVPRAEFKNESSTHVLQGITGVPLLGNNAGDGSVTSIVPNLYYALRPNDRLAVGVGIYAPFALSTEYNDHWVGRYHAIDTEILTFNINPTIAYRFNKHFSAGVGLNAQWLDTELSNAIDFGTIDATVLGGALGLSSQGHDGKATVKGDSWAFGFNLGIMVEMSGNSRLGIAYRSRMSHDVEGDVDFENVPSMLPMLTGGSFTDTGACSEVDLPDSFSVSYYHAFNEQWAVMADVTWTHWHLFDELRFKFDSGQPEEVTTENWEDSYRYSIGVTYTATEQLVLRSGLSFDESPIPGEEYRTPRIPCEDRFWVAFGGSYNFSTAFRLDLSYAHLFVEDPEIDKNPTGENALRGGLKGSYDAAADILSIQCSYRF